MSNEVLKIHGLTKKFGNRTIVDNLNLNLYAGEVFGFAGPNGAGKTTTIKMIAGLLLPDDGSIIINGHDVAREYEKAMSCFGAIVENPEMYTYLTGMQNLRQVARMRGNISQSRINAVVQMVGLGNRINEKVKKYSLGMKQRLGVALALLHNPKLLVLDEPTNGLDPAGIKDLRDLLRNVAAAEGCCVMVSSHLMAELELMCDRVGFLINGKLQLIDTVQNLCSTHIENGNIMRYTVGDIDKACALLDGMEVKYAVSNGIIELIATAEALRNINKQLVNNDVDLLGVTRVQRRLEDVFIQVSGIKGGAQIV